MEVNDLAQMGQLITGYWVSQAIYVAAKLGVADELARGPAESAAVAARVGAHPPSLARLLRALASVGIFTQQTDGRFALTPLAESLRTDHPQSQRALAIMMGEEQYVAYSRLLYSVRTGERAFDTIYGKPIFDYLAERPEQARNFDAAMTGVHGHETGAMLAAYDFTPFKTLMDIGGGNASLMTALLNQVSSLSGIVFDLPGVAAAAQQNLERANLAERCQVLSGSFFESVPAGADAYLMRHILHDWNDDQCRTILKNVRQVLPSEGVVLIVENVIEPGNAPSFSKLLDLTMLCVPGGAERTRGQWESLLASAGFQLARVVPTQSEVSILESRPL